MPSLRPLLSAASGRPIRVEGRALKTAYWKMTHPSTGRKVHLVGMMHVGDDAYYRAMSNLVARLRSEGAHVQYELVQKASGESLKGATRDEVAALGRVRTASAAGGGAAALGKLLGLSFQKTHLRLPDDAENVDVDDLYLLRRLGEQDLTRLVSSSLGDVSAADVRMVLRLTFRLYFLVTLLTSVLPRPRALRRVILHARNEVALEAAHAHLSKGDVVLVWGAAHLPGMAADLLSRGYRVEERYWCRATRL